MPGVVVGQTVASFSLATSERWNNKDGERQERTEWHRLVAWGKLAEFTGQYVSKGSLLYVEGRLQTHPYETKDGETRKATEIIIQNIQLLERRSSEEPAAEEAAEDAIPF